MYVTVSAKWSTGKVQFDGYSVIRFDRCLLLKLNRGQP
jgi:hypothetical protein